MLCWEHIRNLGAVGAVEEHANEHHAANDVAQGDWQEVPENHLTEAHTGTLLRIARGRSCQLTTQGCDRRH